MAAPVFVKRVIREFAGELTTGLITRTMTGFVPTGHKAIVRFNAGVVENDQDYQSDGDAFVHTSVWEAVRNNTGAASTDGAVFSAVDETTVGSAVSASVTLDASNGTLTLIVDPTGTDLSAVLGRAVIDLFSWPNTVES